MNGQQHVRLTTRLLRLVTLQTAELKNVFLDFIHSHMQATPTRSLNVAEFIKGPSTYTIVLFFEQRNICFSFNLKTNLALRSTYKESYTNHQLRFDFTDGDCSSERRMYLFSTETQQSGLLA